MIGSMIETFQMNLMAMAVLLSMSILPFVYNNWQLYGITWIELNSTLYKPCAVVLNSDFMPVFGVIKEIFNINTNYFFVCDVWETSCFVSRIHAYEVTYSHTVAVFNVDHLFDYHPLDYIIHH